VKVQKKKIETLSKVLSLLVCKGGDRETKKERGKGVTGGGNEKGGKHTHAKAGNFRVS